LIGGDRKSFRIKGKPVKVWSVPEPEFFDDEEQLDIPSAVTEEF
jgi:hypothetical protein